MTRIAYSCPFVPAEWIAAAGLVPWRIVPRPAGAQAPVEARAGLCPYARAFACAVIERPFSGTCGTGVSPVESHHSDDDTSRDMAGIVVTTACDQMRRIADVLHGKTQRPVFLMHVPRTWQDESARALYRQEIERLGRFLVRCGGRYPEPAALAEMMRQYDRDRCARRNALWEKASRAGDAVRLAMIGGPLRQGDAELVAAIEDAGGTIVLDGTEQGERTWPVPMQEPQLADDPLAELARMYFEGVRDVARRPNSAFYDWLKGEVARCGVRGVIVRRYVWCDLWHAEVQRIRDVLQLPVLDLDIDDEADAVPPRVRTRVQAFLEMFRSGRSDGVAIMNGGAAGTAVAGTPGAGGCSCGCP